MSDIENTLKEIRQQVERVGDDVKRTAEEALRQAKDTGKVADEVKQTADKLLVTQSDLKGKMEALEARQLELEQGVESRRGREEQPKSMGQQVAESDEVKQFLANGARGSVRVPVKQAITSASGSAGALIVPDNRGEIVGIARRRLRIRQLLGQGRTTSNLVEYARQTTRTNGAAVVSESVQKPSSNYVWAAADAPVRTIAHIVPITRQAMEDAAQLQTEIDSEMRYGLDIEEEDQLLNGDGTGQNLNGLNNQATAYAAEFAPTSEQELDKLRLAFLQLELANYDGDAAILHPSDWALIELLKDSQGRYIFANPQGLAGPVLWGRQVVPTAAQAKDTFTVGQFDVAATIYDRMDAEVLFSSEDSDNFQKNMITARAEKRLALAVKRAAALVKGDFGNVT
ncbi:phage major capsid protein [Phenylobacterium sp.]|uniref:phage major capsid protein n=1 Tax=Phenylobacterium sp. TaxID=1871053 RepID=UPI00391AC033